MIDTRLLRPTNFNQVVGNHKNIELLTNALKFGFPNFVILTGEEGIGKTTVSKILAKHLTCDYTVNGLACEECDKCKSVNNVVIRANKDNANVVTFRMSDEGGKRAARRVEEYIRQVPIGGGKKVIILEEVQGISKEAQDLLLPILEYIPEDTKLIACTTNIKALQKTFTSRANVFQFVVPQRKETTQLLEKICQAMGIKVVGNSVLPRIVEYSGNKPRASVMTLQKLSSQGNELNIQIVNDFLNLISEEYYLEYLTILRGDMGLVLDFIDKLEKHEVPLTGFVKELNNFMIKLITLRFRSVYLPESIIEKAKSLLKTLDEKDLLKLQTIISEESPKIVDEEYAKAQFIAMSFKLMNRNAEELLTSTIKSKVQVDREKDLAMKKYSERTKQAETKTQIEGLDISNNLNALLEGMEAKIVTNNE